MDEKIFTINQYLAIETDWLQNFLKLDSLSISQLDLDKRELLIGNRTDTNYLEEQAQHGFSIDTEGIATVHISGPITYNYSIWNMFFGWPSVTALLNDLDLLEESKEVKGILLILDSPGGQASGMTELTDRLNTYSKPVISWGTFFASGAMFIATACQQSYIEAMGTCGSIGVMYSQWRKDANEITIVSKNAPNKNANPESKEGLEAILKVLDGLEATFLERISQYTGIPTDVIIKKWGQGGLLPAQDAKHVGMVTDIKSLNETYRILLNMTIKQTDNDSKVNEHDDAKISEKLALLAKTNSELAATIDTRINQLEAKVDDLT